MPNRLPPHSTAVVTGAGTGIGRAVALSLARRGINVVLNGRRTAPLDEVAQLIEWQSCRAVVVPGDITVAAIRADLITAARRQFGQIGVIVHCAGVLASGSVLSLDAADLQTAIDANLTAAMDLTRLALPDLIATQGHLVFVGSTMSFVPLPYTTAYCAAKAGLRGFAEALRYEVEPLGVQVLAAYPPGVDTALVQGMAQRAGLPAIRLEHAELTGEKIVRALESGQRQLVWCGGERLLTVAHWFAPRLIHRLLAAQRVRFRRAMTPPEKG